jgi:hypothetical protein
MIGGLVSELRVLRVPGAHPANAGAYNLFSIVPMVVRTPGLIHP